jgi:hypothetical protein
LGDVVWGIEVDIYGEGDTPGDSLISTSVTASATVGGNKEESITVNLGNLGLGDNDADGWDDVLGKTLIVYVSRKGTDASDTLANTAHLHQVEVR